MYPLYLYCALVFSVSFEIMTALFFLYCHCSITTNIKSIVLSSSVLLNSLLSAVLSESIDLFFQGNLMLRNTVLAKMPA